MILVRRLLAVIAVVLATTTARIDAHPLGNFTVNHLVRVTLAGNRATVCYVLDEAEIPSFAILRALDPRVAPSARRVERWANAEARTNTRALVLTVDDVPAALALRAVHVETRPGAAGLRTLYLVATYVAAVRPGARRLTISDETYPGRLGWHDVVFNDEREPTSALRAYPNALVGSPRDRVARAASLRAAGVLVPLPDAASVDGTSPRFSIARGDALSRILAAGASTPLVILVALLLAAGLGALHALEPGHGKTLLAVSLVGARATPAQAIVLAASLTAAHTVGVLVLGVAVLLFTRWIVPEAVYPWLALASGIVVAVLGARALAREIARRHPFVRVHAHGHPHALTFRSALLAAVSGNVAPCPAALVVLLAAIAMQRVAYGLALIVAFSAGLALVLVALGLGIVHGAAWLTARPRFDHLVRHGPLVTAVVISVIGASLLAQGFVAQGIAAPPLLVAALAFCAIAGYAFTATVHPTSLVDPLAEGERS